MINLTNAKIPARITALDENGISHGTLVLSFQGFMVMVRIRVVINLPPRGVPRAAVPWRPLSDVTVIPINSPSNRTRTSHHPIHFTSHRDVYTLSCTNLLTARTFPSLQLYTLISKFLLGTRRLITLYVPLRFP